MRHKIKQFDITDDTQYKEYKELLNDPCFTLINESSEFSRDGQYIVLVHGIESEVPSKSDDETNEIDILNMGLTQDRREYEDLYNDYEVRKEVLSFDKKTNCFKVAVHWLDKQTRSINTRIYRDNLQSDNLQSDNLQSNNLQGNDLQFSEENQ